MKIVEAMKKLKLIEKRMSSNNESITKYASGASNETPIFLTEEKQKAEVQSFIQANKDLMKEYLGLKTQIERTNLGVSVEIEGESYTISELLIIKRKLGRSMIDTYRSLNTNRIQNVGYLKNADGVAPTIVRYYDETERNEGIRKYEDLYHTIDSRLEIVNATTDLVA